MRLFVAVTLLNYVDNFLPAVLLSKTLVLKPNQPFPVNSSQGKIPSDVNVLITVN